MRGNWFLMSLKFTLGFILYFMILAWVIMKLWNGLIPSLTGWSILHYNDAFKHKFGHKWSNLTSDERDKLRAKFKEKWCHTKD